MKFAHAVYRPAALFFIAFEQGDGGRRVADRG